MLEFDVVLQGVHRAAGLQRRQHDRRRRVTRAVVVGAIDRDSTIHPDPDLTTIVDKARGAIRLGADQVPHRSVVRSFPIAPAKHAAVGAEPEVAVAILHDEVDRTLDERLLDTFQISVHRTEQAGAGAGEDLAIGGDEDVVDPVERPVDRMEETTDAAIREYLIDAVIARGDQDRSVGCDGQLADPDRALALGVRQVERLQSVLIADVQPLGRADPEAAFMVEADRDRLLVEPGDRSGRESSVSLQGQQTVEGRGQPNPATVVLGHVRDTTLQRIPGKCIGRAGVSQNGQAAGVAEHYRAVGSLHRRRDLVGQQPVLTIVPGKASRQDLGQPAHAGDPQVVFAIEEQSRGPGRDQTARSAQELQRTRWVVVHQRDRVAEIDSSQSIRDGDESAIADRLREDHAFGDPLESAGLELAEPAVADDPDPFTTRRRGQPEDRLTGDRFDPLPRVSDRIDREQSVGASDQKTTPRRTEGVGVHVARERHLRKLAPGFAVPEVHTTGRGRRQEVTPVVRLEHGESADAALARGAGDDRQSGPALPVPERDANRRPGGRGPQPTVCALDEPGAVGIASTGPWVEGLPDTAVVACDSGTGGDPDHSLAILEYASNRLARQAVGLGVGAVRILLGHGGEHVQGGKQNDRGEQPASRHGRPRSPRRGSACSWPVPVVCHRLAPLLLGVGYDNGDRGPKNVVRSRVVFGAVR